LSISSISFSKRFHQEKTTKKKPHTLNLPVMARQPHPDPNYAPHAAARRAAGA